MVKNRLTNCLLLPLLFFSHATSSAPFNAPKNNISFASNIGPIPPTVQTEMKKYTWHNGCPVALDELTYIQLSYWGFDHQTHQGILIVNKELAHEVVAIFKQLYLKKFPIQSMKPMEIFHGNDNASMAANNTSAFNCRDLTNKPGVFSQHSYGRAIDINPLINPFVKGKKVSPEGGNKFLNRYKPYPGKIIKNDFVSQLFIQHGWDWGAHWYDVQDYQHFEKRANGAKRNPYGN
ncbi:M15 family metallopeptidase [Legionella maioricensis]|uniref:M15 family metallopeptidase n=1 Tax=Legionella maioricensis TaxID=2896528 RepID=A0A9X2CYR7_9GAMM|nr:M15 family metallopeptidase [Legionella maioricensis]MCL9682998.1 M15 family metallopeptidase [Legionella maioricensis]MCL9686346.1 M15 family metallopeptidase [Legionella maioricensis]